MFRRLFLSGFALLLLYSCATVGTIEGGERDRFAPKPIAEKTFPPNQSTQFTASKISITFDEYIKLQQAQENIRITPSGPKLKTSVSKKTLEIELDGKLEANTTYQLILANAVADLHEGNDSILFYVFSTGEVIDSLRYTGFVKDAYTGVAKANMTVGLYQLDDSIQAKPRYAVKSKENGEFEFSYLKQAEFKLLAFDDVNKNLQWDRDEKVAFRSQHIDLKETQIDSIPLNAFQPKSSEKITTKKFSSPRTVIVAGTKKLDTLSYFYNNERIPKENLFAYHEDSLHILLPNVPKGEFSVTSNVGDSIVLRTSSTLPKMIVELLPTSKEISNFNDHVLLFNDKIRTIDTSKITITFNDSIRINGFTFKKNVNCLRFEFPIEKTGNLKVKFAPQSITFDSIVQRDTLVVQYQVKSNREFGTIIFSTHEKHKQKLMELYVGNKLVSRKTIPNEAGKMVFDGLAPGEYTVKLIVDQNQNGKWDTGDVVEAKQAEEVEFYPEKIKVRANWETEVTIE